MATYDLTSSTPTKIKTGDIINCSYGGSVKSITLPKGAYKLECWGAQGGSYNTTYAGGKGGYSYGTLTLTENTVLYLYAGGAGTKIASSGSANGGFNGGGKAYTSGSTYTLGSGGGASDIRIGQDSLYARVIVAGGGGGCIYSSSYRCSGGAGGGTSGATGVRSSSSYPAGTGGTQTSGGLTYYTSSISTAGTFGTGGYGGAYTNGGGGGWYGGGGSRRSAAGGGSGYVYTSSTASNYPSGCLLNSSYYLTDASTTTGNASFVDYSGSMATGHSGNGACRITVIKINSIPFRIKTNDSTWKECQSAWLKINDTTWKEIGNAQLKLENIDNNINYIKYIEATGTQYIDTGFTPNQDTRIVIDFRNTKSSGLGALFGARNGTTSAVFAFWIDPTNNLTYPHYGNVAYTANGSISNDLSVRQIFELNKNIAIVKDTFLACTAATFNTNYNLCLFTLNTAGSLDSRYTTGRLYSCKIYDNDILIRDFRPCLNPDGVACLYDKVNQQYYYNAGTGTFTAGPEVTGWSGGAAEPEIPTISTVDITASNISQYFTVSNGSYYFAGNGNTFTSNNQGVHDSTATTTFTAKYDMDISFTYSYGGEANYDKFTLVVGSTTLANALSGSNTSKTYTGTITTGTRIALTYSKDGSMNNYQDCGTISDIKITGIFT